MKSLFLVFLVAGFVKFLYAQDQHTELTMDIENEIWSLEESYFSLFSEANYDSILSFYHSDFLGWPDSRDHPAGKTDAVKYLKEKFPEPTNSVIRIDKEGIRVTEFAVITHYLVRLSYTDKEGSEHKIKSRITHTWIKENGKWKILGGMSNRQ